MLPGSFTIWYLLVAVYLIYGTDAATIDQSKQLGINSTNVTSASCPMLGVIPPTPNARPTGAMYVGYYESWSDPTASNLCLVPTYYNIVILSFVNPNFKLDGCLSNWIRFFPSASANLKNGIAILRSRGTRVLVSAGGWCYSVDGDSTCKAGGISPSKTSWAVFDPKDTRYSPAQYSQSLQNLKDFVDDFGLDGVDIDFETNGYPSSMSSPANCQPSNGGGSWVPPGTNLTQTCGADPQYINIINQFRSAFPKPYLLSSAVHGYGAYGEGIYDNVHMAPGWGGLWWNGGMSLGMLKASGNKLDWLNVMSYDANTYWNPATRTYTVNPNNNNVNIGFFDPTTALLAYKQYFSGPILLGIEPPMEGFPADQPSTPCHLGHCLTIEELKYLLGFISSQNGGGIMIWAIQKQPQPQYAAYPDPNTISKQVCTFFNWSNCQATFPLGSAVSTASTRRNPVPNCGVNSLNCNKSFSDKHVSIGPF